MQEQWSLIKREIFIAAFALILAFPYWIGGTEYWQWIISGILFLLSGLPHGALDHKVWGTLGQAGQNFNWLWFLAFYFSLMIVTGVFWFFLPNFALLIFLIVSCYHFGQSQLYYWFSKENNINSGIIYIIWGSAVFLSLFNFHFPETVAIVNSLPGNQSWVRTLPIKTLWAGSIILAILIFFLAFLFKYLTYRHLIMEILNLAIFQILFATLPLVLGFSLYFCLWHSLKAILIESKTINAPVPAFRLNAMIPFFKTFYFFAFPFTLISLLGIMGLIFAIYFSEINMNWVMVFFIGISVLTMPHMVLMDRLYKKMKLQSFR